MTGPLKHSFLWSEGEGKLLTKTWMMCCWKSGLNIAKMANLGQLAIKPLVIRQREGRIYRGGGGGGVSG